MILKNILLTLAFLLYFSSYASLHTHTHIGFPCFMGTFHIYNNIYIVQTVYSVYNPVLWEW